MSLVGRQVNQIRILERIGQGGMGDVYVGFDETLERKVALKSIRGDRQLHDTSRARFLREARILSQLEHPNICRIYDYIEHEQLEFLVLELIDGVNLAHAIKRGIDYKTGLRIAIEIAGVLAAAHAAGIVHRDLKPDNVMITREGQVKVLDFGLARSEGTAITSIADEPEYEPTSPADATPAGLTETVSRTVTIAYGSGSQSDSGKFHTALGTVMGTPLYMSPEQARGEAVTTASDMYSFGLLLQTLFTKRGPYPTDLDQPSLLRRVSVGETLKPEGLGRDLNAVLSKLTSLAPAARATAVDAVARLQWLSGKPKRRMRIGAAIAVAVLATAAGLKYTLDLRRERAVALAARQVADQRRGQAESLIGFMLGDVREKLEPLGQLAVLDEVGDKALEYFASVAEEDLSDQELARRAQALYQIGDVRIRQGDLAAAIPALEQAVTLSDGLLTRDPQNEQWLETSALSHFWIGNGYWNRGDLRPALREFEAYHAFSVRLYELDPADPDRKMEVSYGEFNIGSVLEALGELVPAGEHLSECVRIAGELVEAQPERIDWRLELATNHLQTGRIHEAVGDLEAARFHYDTDLRIMTELTRLEPDRTDWLEQLAIAHNHVGQAAERRGELSLAHTHFRSHLDVARRLVTHDLDNFWWKGILAIGQSNMGRLLYREGSIDEGLMTLHTALQSFEDLGVRDPSRRQWRREHALANVSVARALLDRGDVDLALDGVQAAGEALLQLTLEVPDDSRLLTALAEAELLSGDALNAIGRNGEAQEAWTHALTILEPFTTTSRDGSLLAPLAVALIRLERQGDADPLLDVLEKQGFSDPRLPNR